MAARFPSLSHNRVDPCFRRGNRLVEVCSSRQQHATGVLERADPSGIGQPEVKADNGWRSIDQQRQHLVVRSEEHTSELQSLMRISYAVFCLKKKKKHKQTKI